MENKRNNNRRNNFDNITLHRISFTYSENFNKVVNLTTENYPSWKIKSVIIIKHKVF